MAWTVRTSVSTSGPAGATPTLVIPSTVVTGDILVVAVTIRDVTTDPTVTDNDSGGNAWTKLAGQNANTNGAVTIWWKRATSATASKTVTVTAPASYGSCSAGLTPFAGGSKATTATTGPFTGTTVVSEANASGNVTQAQITTTDRSITKSMVFLVVGATSNDTLNVNSQTSTDPSTLTERFEGVSTTGQDCSCSLASAAQTGTGVTGAFNWLMTAGTSASLAFAMLSLVDDLVITASTFGVTPTAATFKRTYVFPVTGGDLMATTKYALTPESAHYPATNFPALAQINQRPVLAFDQSTQETCYWSFVAPQGLTNALSVVIHMFGNLASANATYWEAALEAVTPGDATDLDSTTSFDTVNTGNVAMPATQGHQTSLAITLTNADSIAAGDYVRLSLARDADNGSDNFAADAYVTLVELREA